MLNLTCKQLLIGAICLGVGHHVTKYAHKGGNDDSPKAIMLTVYTSTAMMFGFASVDYAAKLGKDSPLSIPAAFLFGIFLGPPLLPVVMVELLTGHYFNK
jgi:hypothetical protein